LFRPSCILLIDFFVASMSSMEQNRVMVNDKSRHKDKSVTTPSPLPVLVPTNDEGLGDVMFQEGKATRFQAVERYFPSEHKQHDKQEAKRLAAIARLLALASGQEIDVVLMQEGFRTLTADAFGTELADSISAKAPKNKKGWSWRWLPGIFNREIQKARLVMWCPRKTQAFIPAIYCLDHATARLATLLLSNLFGGWRACLGCGEMFLPHRRDQLYHDHLCAHRHRQRRSRQRKGEQHAQR
jgi:hypothetical protein